MSDREPSADEIEFERAAHVKSIVDELNREGVKLNHGVVAARLESSYPGFAYDRKLDEGHTPKEAIRALKRRISNIVYRHLIADTTRASRTR